MSGNNFGSDMSPSGRTNAQTTADKVRQAQTTSSDLRSCKLPNTNTPSGMGKMGSSKLATNASELYARGLDTAEVLRQQTYGHSSALNSNKYGGHVVGNNDTRAFDNSTLTRSGMDHSTTSELRGDNRNVAGQTMSGVDTHSGIVHNNHTRAMGAAVVAPGSQEGPTTLPHHPHQITGDSAAQHVRTFVTRTGINSGAGIHAQQFAGPDTGADYGASTTRYVSDIGDNRQIPSTLPATSELKQGRGTNVAATEHGHPMGLGKEHGCGICTGATIGVGHKGIIEKVAEKITSVEAGTEAGMEHGHPLGQGEATGCQPCINRAAGLPVDTPVKTMKDTKTFDGASHYNLKPGEVIIEEETRVHRGVLAADGSTSSIMSTTRTPNHRSSAASTGSGTTHKTSLKDKLLGKHSSAEAQHHTTSEVAYSKN